MWPNKKIKITRRKYRKKGKMPYGTKQYANPFFSKKKKIKISHQEFSLRVKLFFLGFILIIVLTAWLLFYSNLFNITEIKVLGGERVNPSNIEKIAWQQIRDNIFILFPQKNIFFFSRGKLRKNLEMKYSFNSLIITKKLSHTLTIQFAEKRYALIWHEDDQHYYTDENGYIISEANILEIRQKDYPIIDNLTKEKIFNNRISIDKIYTDYVLMLFQQMKEYENFVVERYILDSDINTIKMVLVNGPVVYFNIQEDMEKQINKLVVIKEKKIKDDFISKTYIDLRYGDRVYYR